MLRFNSLAIFNSTTSCRSKIQNRIATSTTAAAIASSTRFCSSTTKSENTTPTSINNENNNTNNSNSKSEEIFQEQQIPPSTTNSTTRRVMDSSHAKLVERIEYKPGLFARYWKWFIVGGAASGAFIWTAFDHFNDRVLTRSARCLVSGATILAMYKFTYPETEQQISDMNTRAAKTLLDLCRLNEGLYIKMGQQIHSLNQVLPPEYSKVLKVLLDDAPDVDVEIVKKIVQDDLGQSVDELFVEWDSKPIASASIAQVHRAKLRTEDGQIHDVAVKVQKPNIKKQMWWDIQCYFLFCYAVWKGFNLPVWWSAQHIAEKLSLEIDFRKEADHINYARSLLLKDPNSTGEDAGDVYVPKVFSEALSPRVLCTEWIDSVKLHEGQKVRDMFDVPAVMTSLVRSYADLIFDSGFVHADPHPANVLVRPHPRLKKKISDYDALLTSNINKNNSSSTPQHQNQIQKLKSNEHQVVFIDWGLAIKESEKFKEEYARLFKSVLVRDEKQITDIVTSWGISDAQLFASLLMQKPISLEKSTTPVHSTTVTKDKVLEMQLKMKEKATTLLEDESKTPQELILLGRGMNLIRAINKSFDAPVNRVNILAERAARSLGIIRRKSGNNSSSNNSIFSNISAYSAELRFHFALAWLSFMFHFLNWYSQTIQWLSLTFVGKAVKPRQNMETMLDSMENQIVEQVTGTKRSPAVAMTVEEYNEPLPEINEND